MQFNFLQLQLIGKKKKERERFPGQDSRVQFEIHPVLLKHIKIREEETVNNKVSAAWK